MSLLLTPVANRQKHVGSHSHLLHVSAQPFVTVAMETIICLLLDNEMLYNLEV
jgi:hypothetical protein